MEIMPSIYSKIVSEYPPRTIEGSRGELIFLDGQLLFHYFDREAQTDAYKLLTVDSVRQAFMKESFDSGWIPEGIARWGITPGCLWFVKFIPPGRHKFYFADMGLQFPSRSQILPMPALVFVGIGSDKRDRYHVFALAEDKILTHVKQEVFYAPLPNIGNNGAICFGDANPPKVTLQNADAAWKLFLETEFNNHSQDKKSQYSDKSIYEAYQHFLTPDSETYPVSDLVRFRYSFDSLIKELMNA